MAKRRRRRPATGSRFWNRRRSTAETFGIPLAVLAELTHRCPLQCPYCSNPIELDRGGSELTTEEWKKVLSELAEIGVLQIHFSGGEPTARKDLVELVQHATDVGLYTNLITSAVLLTKEKLSALADAGLCHVQISFQGNEPDRRRPRRRPEECAREEDRSREMDARARSAAHGQRRDAPPEPASARRHHPDGGRSRRRPARSRQCPVLRLGAEEPRRADADDASRSRRPAASSRKPRCG